MAKNLRELIEEGIVSPSLLAEKNDYLLNEAGKEKRKTILESGDVESFHSLSFEEKGGFLDLDFLDRLDGYTVPLLAHDYGAKTPIMWNTLYEKLGLNVRNLLMVGDPERAEEIMDAFRSDPKYLGGGFGVGFKEKLEHLDRIVPEDLKAVNIVVREGEEIVGYNTDALGFVMSLEESLYGIGKKVEGGNFIVLGAGGVGKEVGRLIASKNPNSLTFLNRTKNKAVVLARDLYEKFPNVEFSSGGEDIIRGYSLNSFRKPDAIINTTDKGSDGKWEKYAAFADTLSQGHNENISRTIARELARLNPDVIVADVTISRSGKPFTLRIAENEGLKNLLDGIPMVVNQAAPAYIYVQNAHPKVHEKKVSEEEALSVFKEAVNN